MKLTDLIRAQQPVAPGLVHANFMRGIDPRLIGKNPSTDRTLFSAQDHSTPAYTRSTTVWTDTADLTCWSVWNSDGAGGTQRGATAMSPRHVAMANHFSIANGSTIRFVTNDNVVVNRTLTTSTRVGSTDIQIGLLDSDLPKAITFARVLPANCASFLKEGGRFPTRNYPIIVGDAERKANVSEWVGDGSVISWGAPTTSPRQDFWEVVIGGDSGSPVFLLAGDMPVLLGAVHLASNGDSISGNLAAVDAAMTSLGGGYTTTQIDLKPYQLLNPSARDLGMQIPEIRQIAWTPGFVPSTGSVWKVVTTGDGVLPEGLGYNILVNFIGDNTYDTGSLPLSAAVSAENEITVRMWNPTGDDIEVSAGSLSVWIFRHEF